MLLWRRVPLGHQVAAQAWRCPLYCSSYHPTPSPLLRRWPTLPRGRQLLLIPLQLCSLVSQGQEVAALPWRTPLSNSNHCSPLRRWARETLRRPLP